MKLEGEHTLPGTPERMWKLLLDPDVLVAAIPGCEQLERVDEDEYRGVISAKIGSIESQYTTTFKLFDKAYPNSYRLHVEGEGPGGFVDADVLIELIPVENGTTRLRHSGEANVGGRIARIGQRMVQAAAKMMVEKGFRDLKKRVEQRLDAEQEPGDGTSDPSDSESKGFANRVRGLFRRSEDRS